MGVIIQTFPLPLGYPPGEKVQTFMHPQDSLAMTNLINIKLHNRSGLHWKQDKWSPGEDHWNNSGWMMVKLNNDSNTTPFHLAVNDLHYQRTPLPRIRSNALVPTVSPIRHSTIDTTQKHFSFLSSEIEPAILLTWLSLAHVLSLSLPVFSGEKCYLHGEGSIVNA